MTQSLSDNLLDLLDQMVTCSDSDSDSDSESSANSTGAGDDIS